MTYFIIGACVAAVLIVCVILVVKIVSGRDKKKSDSSQNVIIQPRDDTALQEDTYQPQEFVIRAESISADSFEESDLHEITDKRLLAHIDNFVPLIVQGGNAAYDIFKASKLDKEVLYKAILPFGAKLAKSRDMDGAFRGFFHGENGIAGHANLVQADTNSGMTKLTNAASGAMAVAAMVVGQYYMTQINTELDGISRGISDIADFQDSEYKGKVESLVSHVQVAAQFKEEILSDPEQRDHMLTKLDMHEKECTELIGQANNMLENYTEKNDLKYEEYVAELEKAQKWFVYREQLCRVLYGLSELKFTVSLGKISREQCGALYNIYSEKAKEVSDKLIEWHNKAAQRLGINVEEERRKRTGFDSFIHFIPGLISDSQKFRPIEKDTVEKIKIQSEDMANEENTEKSDLYSQDVQLIIKDGKIYYLPPIETP